MPDVRLIDANALLDFISDERKEAADNKNHEKMRGNDYEMHFWSGALVQARWIRQYVNEAPTIDAVPVVRCRECKYYNRALQLCNNGLGMREFDFYCADGKKKDAKDTNVPGKPEDCRYFTAHSYWGAGCLGTKEIDHCEGEGCKRWKPKMDGGATDGSDS